MIEKIISGGQTGADQGGLEAGKELGLETGGTAPQMYMTELGPCLKLRYTYGLKEGVYDPKTYPKRTRKNIVDSDATVIFGLMGEPGSKLTCNICVDLGKPWVVNPNRLDFQCLIAWHSVKVLNVAGNRESRNPGIQLRVRNFLVDALKTREPSGTFPQATKDIPAGDGYGVG